MTFDLNISLGKNSMINVICESSRLQDKNVSFSTIDKRFQVTMYMDSRYELTYFGCLWSSLC